MRSRFDPGEGESAREGILESKDVVGEVALPDEVAAADATKAHNSHPDLV